MSEIRLTIAEYLQKRGLTPERLVEAVGTATQPEMVYQLVQQGDEQRQIDLSTLAAVIQGLGKLTGFPVGIEEVLKFIPDMTDLENNPWREFHRDEEDLYYDWGDVDPMNLVKPVRYVHGIGLVVDDDEVAVTSQEDINELNRITLDPEVMEGKPCIRGLPIAVETIIALIASHYSTAEILQEYPNLEEEDLHEALAYAARRIQETKFINKKENGNREVEPSCDSTT